MSSNKRRISILIEYPDERFEAVVLQWEDRVPTVLIQLARNGAEPIQFPGKRPEIPGNETLPKDQPLAIDLPLEGFVDASTTRTFGKAAHEADILFSIRAFSTLQPEPDLVLPPEAIYQCRTEALRALRIEDRIGF